MLYTGLPGPLTAVRRAGNLVLVTTSSGVTSFITVLSRGATPGAAYTRLGSIDLTFTPTWWHQSYALAVRQVPGDATRQRSSSTSGRRATTPRAGRGGVLRRPQRSVRQRHVAFRRDRLPSDAGTGVIHQVAAVPGDQAVLAGATFLADGTSARSGPAVRIAVFATGAEPGFAYQLVSGRDGGRNDPGSTDVAPVSGAVKYANASGVVGSTAGVLERPPGPWQVCFRSVGPGLRTVAAAVTYTVT